LPTARRSGCAGTPARTRVADPRGLPPAYIEVGQLDIFRDEDLTYALRLGQAGVPHCFDVIAFNSAVVGDNDAGKSTILQSIELALSGRIGGCPADGELSPHWFPRTVTERYPRQLKEEARRTVADHLHRGVPA
jgi:hypothetical protein